MSPSYLYYFKAAVHLNNTAITLLQKRCYRQAAETLIDAVAVMKDASSQPNVNENTPKERLSLSPSIDTNDQDTTDFLQQKLTKAAQRLSSLEPSTLGMETLIQLHVMSDDEHPSVVKHYRALQTKIVIGKQDRNALPSSSEASSFSVMPIAYILRMEPPDFETPLEQNIDIESAIILYNYGVALQCLSTLPQTAEATEKLHAASYHLFELAYSSLLSRDLEVLRTSAPSQLYRILLVAQLSLDQLVQLAKVLHMEVEQNDYDQCFEHLQNSIPDFCLVFNESFTPRAARAA